MSYITKSELQEDLKYYGLPQKYAAKIMKRHGNGGKIDEVKAKTVIKNLLISQHNIERYEPRPIFEDTYFMPEKLLEHIDRAFLYLKEKYRPYGLKIPFTSWEEARSWLRKESLEGVLNTPRLQAPGAPNNDFDADLYWVSILHLPYEKLDNGINNLICNSSAFLLELRYKIESLSWSTGIDEIDLLKYFLCEIKPNLNRISLRKYEVANQYFTIKISAPDITKKEWLEIYDKYREETGQKHKKPLNNRMKSFAKLVKMLDDIPEKPNHLFYKELMKKWNEVSGEDIQEWRTIYRMHERLNKKEKSLGIKLKEA